MNTSPETDVNFVEDLRSSLKESEVKQYLKKSLGGYTRSSVMEYLGNLRKQQLRTADTFALNYQVLSEEKEKLNRASENLKGQLEQTQAEYRELAESIKSSELEGEGLSVSYVVALKSRLADLERQLSDSALENTRIANASKLDKESLSAAAQKLEQAEKEKRMLRELLTAQSQKEREWGVEIAGLKSQVAQKDEEIARLNMVITGSHLAELNQRVNELTVQISSQADTLAAYNAEIGSKSRRIEVLEGELKARTIDNGNLIKERELLIGRIDSYLGANEALEQQLEADNKRYIALIKENSQAKSEVASLTRKIEEAGAKISSLELHQGK